MPGAMSHGTIITMRIGRTTGRARPAGLVVESCYTPLTSGWLWARSHTGSCLLGQISGSGPQSQI